MSRILLGAFGDPGHVFPIMGLGRALRARGHEVQVQTAEKWRDMVGAEGLGFAPAPEYDVFPTLGRYLKPYEAVVRATGETRPQIAAFAPDVVVADILTLAPALAAELEGVPVATLVPHVLPDIPDGWPPYSLGARLPRTPLGTLVWRGVRWQLDAGLIQGMNECNQARELVGLEPRPWVHNGMSPELVLVATFPQLEYPREWPQQTHVIGPLQWEPPFDGEVAIPPGEDPLVLIAPSTSQDPGHRLLRASLAGLAGERVRVLATWNRRVPDPPVEVPANAELVEWLSYGRTIPHCDVVVCHGGHGTVVRTLASGAAAVVLPAAGDMNENAARVDWAGAGVRLPRRAATPRAVRLAVGRALAKRSIRARARELQAWAAEHDGGEQGAIVLEQFLERRGAGALASLSSRS